MKAQRQNNKNKANINLKKKILSRELNKSKDGYKVVRQSNNKNKLEEITTVLPSLPHITLPQFIA